MESLKIRYNATIKCLRSLHESLHILEDPKFCEVYKQIRDSVIQDLNILSIPFGNICENI